MKKRAKEKERLVSLTVLVTPQQLQRIVDLSAEYDRSMGHIVRQLIDNDISKGEKN